MINWLKQRRASRHAKQYALVRERERGIIERVSHPIAGESTEADLETVDDRDCILSFTIMRVAERMHDGIKEPSSLAAPKDVRIERLYNALLAKVKVRIKEEAKVDEYWTNLNK